MTTRHKALIVHCAVAHCDAKQEQKLGFLGYVLDYDLGEQEKSSKREKSEKKGKTHQKTVKLAKDMAQAMQQQQQQPHPDSAQLLA